ncbi:MAG: TIM barrel protein [bacterium]
MKAPNRRHFLEKTVLIPAGLLSLSARDAFTNTEPVNFSQSLETDLHNRLFIMNSWFYNVDLNITQQAGLLHELGVPRLACSLGNDRERWNAFPETLEALDKNKIELTAVYFVQEIDSGEMPPEIIDIIQRLKGRDTLVWFALTSKEYKPSDPAGDSTALQILQQAADAAQRAAVHISIYPHFSCWVERVDDAVRLAQSIQRENVGCTLNLYHWLKVEGPKGLKKIAETVLPHLNCVTINGSRKNAADLPVEEGILPLGEGDYDVEEFVEMFVDLGYRGPVGLQGYGIKGDIRAKLRRSIKEWRSYCARIKEISPR